MGTSCTCNGTFNINFASCAVCAKRGECSRRHYNDTVNSRYWLEARSQGKTLYSEISTEMSYVNRMMSIKNVIFNDPATIVFWGDGTKTVVKTQDGEAFDPEKGLTMAFFKKMHGNKGSYFNEVKKWTGPYNMSLFKDEVHECTDYTGKLHKIIEECLSRKPDETIIIHRKKSDD